MDVDHEQSPRTESRTSASSDVEVSSGDSATSGFSSGGSDVNKTTETGNSYENTAVTLGRISKRQKPAVKPKRKFHFRFLSMPISKLNCDRRHFVKLL